MPSKRSIRMTTSFSGVIAALSLCALFIFVAAKKSIFAQESSGQMEALNFKVQMENYPPPNEAQTKTLLEGEKAQPLGNGLILLIAAKISTFATNGALETVAQTPRCIFDSAQRIVSSTGTMSIQSADGRFFLEGVGFLLQTNGNLILSNDVHTIIRMPSEKQTNS